MQAADVIRSGCKSALVGQTEGSSPENLFVASANVPVRQIQKYRGQRVLTGYGRYRDFLERVQRSKGSAGLVTAKRQGSAAAMTVRQRVQVFGARPAPTVAKEFTASATPPLRKWVVTTI